MTSPHDPRGARPTSPQSSPGASVPHAAVDDIDGPTQHITRDELGALAHPMGQRPGAAYPPAPGSYAAPPAAAGPSNAAWGWPASGGAATGYPMPPQPPKKSRKPLLVIGAVAVVAVVVAAVTGVVLMGDSDGAPSTRSSSTSAAASSSTKDANGVYRVVPQKMLPSAEEVQKATMYSVTATGAVSTAPASEPGAVPANCGAAFSSNSLGTWGKAIADAAQAFQDGPDDLYSHLAWTGLAVFRSTADASASLKTVVDSVKSCTGTFTTPSTKNGTNTWKLDNPQILDSSVRWQISVPTGGPWVCSYAYSVKANLVAASSTCGQSANDGPGPLTDLMLAKATK